MNALYMQLFAVFAPIVADIITKYGAAHQGELPTDAQMRIAFEANIVKYMAEGSAWTATHPKKR